MKNTYNKDIKAANLYLIPSISEQKLYLVSSDNASVNVLCDVNGTIHQIEVLFCTEKLGNDILNFKWHNDNILLGEQSEVTEGFKLNNKINNNVPLKIAQVMSNNIIIYLKGDLVSGIMLFR